MDGSSPVPSSSSPAPTAATAGSSSKKIKTGEANDGRRRHGRQQHQLPPAPRHLLSTGPVIDPGNHPDLLLTANPQVNAAIYIHFDWTTYTWFKGINYYCALDIEKSGPRPGPHYMPSLGAVLMRASDGRILHKFFRALQPSEGSHFSKHCRKEFWSRAENAANLKEWAKVAVPYKQGLGEFRDWLYKMQREYGEPRHDESSEFALCTDCPEADITFLSQEFNDHLGENPLYHPEGDESRFSTVTHVNEYGRGVARFDWTEGWDWRRALRRMGVPLPSDDLKDHHPTHDAEYIARTLRAIRWWIRMDRASRRLYWSASARPAFRAPGAAAALEPPMICRVVAAAARGS